MIPVQLQPLVGHLWQSTLFAVVAGALTLAFRNNRAQIRYCLWLVASVKFLIPFSVFVGAGGYLGRHFMTSAAPARLPVVIEHFTESLVVSPSIAMSATPEPAALYVNLVLAGLGTVWTTGFIILISSWWARWRRVLAVRRTASPIQLPINVKAMSSPVLTEPGVFGIYDPVLLLPEGITEQLAPPQLEAILVHELCHIRRRDNLATAIHMVVEAVFWFHPLVWFLGARLMEERERACDEEVLRLGHEPLIYAEGILNVCKSYLKSPLPCASGVTGSNLSKRIRAIVTGCAPCDLNFTKKAVLVTAWVAAIATPAGIGLLNALPIRAPQAIVRPQFEVASIKPITDGGKSASSGTSPGGRLSVENETLQSLILNAYDVRLFQLSSAPGWIGSERYNIEAKARGNPTWEEMKPMLQVLLEERFKLKVHRETKELPVFVLTVARSGLKMQRFKEGSCVPFDPTNPCDNNMVPPKKGRRGEWSAKRLDMMGLTKSLSFLTGRTVIDNTNLTGLFDLHLEWTSDTVAVSGPDNSGLPISDAPTSPSLITAIQEQLGLKLDSGRGPVEILVIDHVERPSKN